MPNWESAEYQIVDKADAIDELEKELEEAMSIEDSSDFDDWLGDLLLHLGYSLEDVEHSRGCPNCRGWITNRWSSRHWMDRDMKSLHIETESAWAPMDECIVEFVRHYCPDAVIYRTQLVEITEVLE